MRERDGESCSAQVSAYRKDRNTSFSKANNVNCGKTAVITVCTGRWFDGIEEEQALQGSDGMPVSPNRKVIFQQIDVSSDSGSDFY